MSTLGRIFGSVSPEGLQHPVETDHAAHLGIRPRHVERTQAAEAETHDRDAPRVDDGHGPGGREARQQPLQQFGPVHHERLHEGAAFLVGRAAFALAEIVEREAGVALPREPPRLALDEFIAPAPGMVDEHRGSRTRLRFVVAEESFEQRVIVAVLDVLLAHLGTLRSRHVIMS
jgi:hypothetical protein